MVAYFSNSEVLKLFTLANEPYLFDFPLVQDNSEDFIARSHHDACLFAMICRAANPTQKVSISQIQGRTGTFEGYKLRRDP